MGVDVVYADITDRVRITGKLTSPECVAMIANALNMTPECVTEALERMDCDGERIPVADVRNMLTGLLTDPDLGDALKVADMFGHSTTNVTNIALIVISTLDASVRKHARHLCRDDRKAYAVWMDNVIVSLGYTMGFRGKLKSSSISVIDFAKLSKVDARFTRSDGFRPFISKGQFQLKRDRAHIHDAFHDQTRGIVPPLLKDNVHLVCAGGAPLRAMSRKSWGAADVDLFVVGCDSKAHATSVAQTAMQAIVELVKSSRFDGSAIIVTLTDCAVTLTVARSDHNSLKIQIILRQYVDVEDVLASFDLGSCCVAYYMGEFYASGRGRMSLTHGTNLVDPTKSTSARRAMKYNKRGFAFVVPVVSSDIIKFVNLESPDKYTSTTGLQSVIRRAEDPRRRDYDDDVRPLYQTIENPAILLQPTEHVRILEENPNYRVWFVCTDSIPSWGDLDYGRHPDDMWTRTIPDEVFVQCSDRWRSTPFGRDDPFYNLPQ